MKKRLKIQLVCVFLMMILTLGSLVSSTMAWLSINKSIASDGMKMNIEVSPNLVISDTKANLQAATNDNADDRTSTATNTSGDYVTVSWAASASDLECATHVSTSTTGLKYNTTPETVSRSTGLGTITLADAVNDDSTFYVDYTVYVGSLDTTMAISHLYATMSTTAELTDAYKSASVDFYLGSVSSSNYKGTLNLAQKNGKDSSGTSLGETAANQKIDITGSTTVPVNTGNSPIVIVMRCYFDGALLKDSTTAYVRSKGLSTTANFSFEVNFTAE